MISRRTLVASLPLLGAAPAFSMSDRFAPLHRAIAKIENDAGGPLGLSLFDSASGATFHHRGGMRFPMCSTFKLLLAARILQTEEIGRDDCGVDRAACPRNEGIRLVQDDVVAPSPFSEPLVGRSVTPVELARAMVTLSDNGAANAALRTIASPERLTVWIRRWLRDPVTRLDRNEPALNSEDLSDPRDTTSPSAMLALSRALLSGQGVLNKRHRNLLLQWMAESQTGNEMIRAGLPAGWTEAHKTGAGTWHARNIVSVITPPSGQRIWVSAYLFAAKSDLAQRNRHFVPLGRAIVESLG